MTLKSHSEPPHGKEMLKKYIDKKVRCIIHGCLCFILSSVLFTPLVEMISFIKRSSFLSTTICVFVVLDTEFGAHDRKISLPKFLRMTEKG